MGRDACDWDRMQVIPVTTSAAALRVVESSAPDPLQCTSNWWRDRELPNVKPMIEPFIFGGERILLWGPTGSAKSAVLLALAHAAATGKPLGKWKPTRQIRTVYIDGEMSRSDLQLRLREMAEHFGDPGENLVAINTIDFEQFAPLDEKDRAEALIRLLRQFRAELVLLDNIQCLVSTSLKEGKAYDALQPLMLAMRSLEATAIWAHHAGFNEDRFYGDSRLSWQASGSLRIERSKGFGMQVGQVRVKVSVDKLFRGIRDGEAKIGQELIFRGSEIECVEQEFDPARIEAGSEKIERADQTNTQKCKRALTTALTKNGFDRDGDGSKWVPTDIWRNHCEHDGVSPDIFRKYKQRLLRDGIVREDGKLITFNKPVC